MDLEGSRRGTRDNGLRCASYAAVADLDPRVADALLAALREEGIAAYAAPSSGTGGAMETRLPDRPIDRLFVDDSQFARAKHLVDAESASQVVAPDPDFETAWQQVLTSLQATPGPASPSWPDEESTDDFESSEASYDPADQDHFEPPPPPPFPRLRKSTIGALAAIAFGLLILALHVDGGSLTPVAIIAILGGVVSLVYNMRSGPPTDSGWDDGAVL
jgi:hypothetical protein